MSIAESTDPVIDRLGSILSKGRLPHPYDRWGARLMAHLTKPVQIVVTGFAGSGKSALIEMISGRPVPGRNTKAPIVELAYAEFEQLIIECADGSISSLAGAHEEFNCPVDAVRVRQELPDNNLISNDFVEMGLHGTVDEKRSMLDAVIERADVVLWCSQAFEEEEQFLWSTVPDTIKDHSLLVLTKADQQLMRGVLSENINRLDPFVSEEFLGLFPVATIQGITARSCAETVNQELWASSGAKHLMELLTRQIRQGRTADFDQARIFMDRLAMRIPQTDLSNPEPPSAGKHLVDREASLSDVSVDCVSETGGLHDSETIAALSEAVDLLKRHSEQMLHDIDTSKELDTDRILITCSEAIDSVSDLVQRAGGSGSQTAALVEAVQEGEEMLMLFQLERGEDAALDAVTLMLQIRKELSEKLAV